MSVTPGSTFVARAEQLDLLSVIKASQTISGVMVEEQLFDTLLSLVLEEGGARRAILILARDGVLTLGAEVSVDATDSRRHILTEAELESRVPLSVIQYVQRTKERLVLDDASIATRFASDPYLVRVRPRSVLCLPIVCQAEVVALLFLENDLVPGAFTPERLMALELLAAQAAISLENAHLLQHTQQALRVREEFLSLASHELRTPLTVAPTDGGGAHRSRGVRIDVAPAQALDRSLRRILARRPPPGALSGELLDATLIERGELRLRPVLCRPLLRS